MTLPQTEFHRITLAGLRIEDAARGQITELQVGLAALQSQEITVRQFVSLVEGVVTGFRNLIALDHGILEMAELKWQLTHKKNEREADRKRRRRNEARGYHQTPDTSYQPPAATRPSRGQEITLAEAVAMSEEDEGNLDSVEIIDDWTGSPIADAAAAASGMTLDSEAKAKINRELDELMGTICQHDWAIDASQVLRTCNLCGVTRVNDGGETL